MPSTIAMFGGLGPPEIMIMLIVVLLFVVIPFLLIKKLLSTVGQRNKSQNHTNRLKELEQMRQEGLIDETEFQEKRQQILSDL
jgi:cytochrome c-type biogenesis protein CcmI